jgi:transcription initiation factor IIE alpha subunit
LKFKEVRNVRCPECGRAMKYNKSGKYFYCCGWQIVKEEKENELSELQQTDESDIC